MAVTAMETDTFWGLLDRARGGNTSPDMGIEALRTLLRSLSLPELIAFEITFRRFLNSAYTWDLWGAAYVIHGGCSDDRFEYFRRWLIWRGREAYEAATANPENLADFTLQPTGPDDVWEFEEIYYVAMDVFEEKSGDGDIRDHSDPEAGLGGPAPSGAPFEDDEAYLKVRYPRLWARFGDNPLG